MINKSFYKSPNNSMSDDMSSKEGKKDKGLTVAPRSTQPVTVRSPQVRRFIDLLVKEGDSIGMTEAARQLGVSKDTVYRWRGLDGFQDEYQRVMQLKHLPAFSGVMESQIKKAKGGSTAAAIFVRDTLGFVPPVRIDVQQIIATLPRAVLDAIASGD